MVDFSNGSRKDSKAFAASNLDLPEGTLTTDELTDLLGTWANQDAAEIPVEAELSESVLPRVEDLRVEIVDAEEEAQLVGAASGAMNLKSTRIGEGGGRVSPYFPATWAGGGDESSGRVEPVSAAAKAGGLRSYLKEPTRNLPPHSGQQGEDQNEEPQPWREIPKSGVKENERTKLLEYEENLNPLDYTRSKVIIYRYHLETKSLVEVQGMGKHYAPNEDDTCTERYHPVTKKLVERSFKKDDGSILVVEDHRDPKNLKIREFPIRSENPPGFLVRELRYDEKTGELYVQNYTRILSRDESINLDDREAIGDPILRKKAAPNQPTGLRGLIAGLRRLVSNGE